MGSVGFYVVWTADASKIQNKVYTCFYLVFQEKKFSHEREFPDTTHNTVHNTREREKETDRQTTIEKTKSLENDGGVVSRAFIFLKIEV